MKTKTPQQWLQEMKLRPCVTENDLLVIIARIQADAQGKRPDFLDEALNTGDGTYKP